MRRGPGNIAASAAVTENREAPPPLTASLASLESTLGLGGVEWALALPYTALPGSSPRRVTRGGDRGESGRLEGRGEEDDRPEEVTAELS